MESGDERAKQLNNKYKSIMPSFTSLKDEELSAIIAFLHTHKSAGKRETKDPNELTNPIADTIELSNLLVNIAPFATFPPSVANGKMPITKITQLGFHPKTGDLFVVDLRGKLYRIQDNKPVIYMDMAALKPGFINEPGLATGFGSFAFHPGFASNGILYTTHTEAAGAAKADFTYPDSIKKTLQWVLTEWKTDNPLQATFSGTGRELFRVDMVSGIHGVQEITFNPLARPGNKDYGMLYIGIGDGGCVENGYAFLAHSNKNIWGTILRIDPMKRNSANGQYGIPPGNPFANKQNEKAIGEIYAYGFRNPHRITWTRSGKMLASNVGQGNIESLDLILPGHDYGWPIREGNFVSAVVNDNLGKVFPLPPDDSIYNITYPIAEYDHDEGKAISGGFEYWGTAIPLLKGKFLFGDIPTGRLFYIDIGEIKQGKQTRVKEWRVALNGITRSLADLCGSNRTDLHFGRDSHGELYILTKADGKLYQLESAALNPKTYNPKPGN